jgi:hypothetical protein
MTTKGVNNMTNLIIDKDTLNKLIAKKVTDEVVACLRDKHVPRLIEAVFDHFGEDILKATSAEIREYLDTLNIIYDSGN